MSDNKLILSFWNIRGRAEPLRMILNYLKLEYEYKGYDLEKYQDWFEKDK
jgi:glutathione S-transferase